MSAVPRFKAVTSSKVNNRNGRETDVIEVVVHNTYGATMPFIWLKKGSSITHGNAITTLLNQYQSTGALNGETYAQCVAACAPFIESALKWSAVGNFMYKQFHKEDYLVGGDTLLPWSN